MTPNCYPANDPQFKDWTIETVGEPEPSGGRSFSMVDGWSFWCPADSPVEPKPGMTARLYGKGLGFVVRGLFLDGREVFYRTEAEQQAESERECREREQQRQYDFEKYRAEHDAKYRALPAAFRTRIDRFRGNNPDFRWEFEDYEVACCEAAVMIADALKAENERFGNTDKMGASGWNSEIEAFRSLSYDEQTAKIPALDDLGLSGNQFGCACVLAYHYLANPENVARIHGAMSPVVGSKAYGDVPRDDS